MTLFDRAGIAQRIRGLIGGQDRGDFAETASRLGVEELSLRLSVDDLSPHPTMEVIMAIVREYGVDPGWLLTGEYQTSSHRAAIEGENLPTPLRDFIAFRRGSISEPPPEHVRAAGEN